MGHIGMEKKKKILLLLSSEPQDGGSHPYALLIAESLVKNRNKNYELLAVCRNAFWRSWCRKNGVCCITQGFPQISELEQKINLLFPHIAKIFNSYQTSMGKFLRHEKINIIFVTRQFFPIANYNVKIVMPVHDLMHRYERRFPEVAEDFNRRELAAKCLSAYGACVLVDSRQGKRQFAESYMKRGRKKPYVCVLPFTVPKYMGQDEEIYIETPKRYVFYPAQFWQHKNHINLVRAIELLVSDISDIHLVLVGSEKNNMGAIRKYIDEHGLNEYITIKGFVSNEKLIYLYRHAVGMIMPSYLGPTNIPPLEAMTLGCPLAVSNKYAMSEQVGDAGLLFDPDSPEEIAGCIKRLWQDEELRQKMIRKGYRRMEKWTTKEFGDRLVKIINKL